MTGSINQWHRLRTLLLGLGLLGCLGLTGCQVVTGGQTLPSPYYMKDDVQYFPRDRSLSALGKRLPKRRTVKT